MAEMVGMELERWGFMGLAAPGALREGAALESVENYARGLFSGFRARGAAGSREAPPAAGLGWACGIGFAARAGVIRTVQGLALFVFV